MDCFSIQIAGGIDEEVLLPLFYFLVLVLASELVILYLFYF